MSGANVEEATHSLGSVARVTGLSPDLLRAWERRYGAVTPLRTDGGTRRYRDSDIARLRLLKSAVDAGHRISHVARLSDRQLVESVAALRPEVPDDLALALDAVTRVDTIALEEIALHALEFLGAAAFARDFALPLLQAVGDRWAANEISIAGEHLASSLIRSMLRGALTRPSYRDGAPRAVFATPEGEAHEFGALAAAVVAMARGVHVTYLGPDLPAEDLVHAVERTRAHVLALGIAHLRVERAREILTLLRARLPDDVEIWIGGAHCTELAGDRSFAIPSIDALEQRIGELGAAVR